MRSTSRLPLSPNTISPFDRDWGDLACLDTAQAKESESLPTASAFYHRFNLQDEGLEGLLQDDDQAIQELEASYYDDTTQLQLDNHASGQTCASIFMPKIQQTATRVFPSFASFAERQKSMRESMAMLARNPPQEQISKKLPHVQPRQADLLNNRAKSNAEQDACTIPTAQRISGNRLPGCTGPANILSWKMTSSIYMAYNSMRKHQQNHAFDLFQWAAHHHYCATGVQDEEGDHAPPE